jgi:hypothetical protein
MQTRYYGPADPVVRALARQHPSIMREKRGAGLWLWKPAIILDALGSVPDGDVVIYTDAGMDIVSNPNRLIRLVDSHPIALFGHSPGSQGKPRHLQRHWTKRDCFVLLDADTPQYWDQPQLIGGIQIYRNGPQARAFVAAWLEACSDPRVMTDGGHVTGKDNFEGFVAHRHDQSILTIMAVRHGIAPWPSPEIDSSAGPRVFDIYRRRPSWLFVRTAKLRGILRPRRRLNAMLDYLRGK